MGLPKANLFDFMFCLVDCGKVLCSVNELEQNSMLLVKKNLFDAY